MNLTDVGAERAVLAGICTHGADAFFDVADIISERTFMNESNSIIYQCLKNIYDGDRNAKIDAPLIYGVANTLGYGYVFKKDEEIKHLTAIMKTPILLPNVRKQAAKIRKLEIARMSYDNLEGAQNQLLEITGGETISHILGIPEQAVLNFTSALNNNTDEEPVNLYEKAEEYLQYLADNPVQQVGISTGMPLHDAAIGGGLRNGGVHVFAARLKVGKSTISLNIANHISKNLGIPVLYLDTEMMEPEQLCRLFALLTETDFNKIETGQFAEDMFTKKKVLDMARKMREAGTPFHYRNIGDKPFEDILSIARRWIMKNVGLNDDGTAKPCVVIYDYLKLMSGEGLSNDTKEHQLLGFMMTGLVNFAKRYNIPVVTLAQTNRDGINKETTDVVGGSDRIGMYCTSLSLLKIKSDEEIAEDGIEYGNRKLVVMATRYGGGMPFGDYIRIKMTGQYAKIEEVGTAFDKHKEEGFVLDDDQDELPFTG